MRTCRIAVTGATALVAVLACVTAAPVDARGPQPPDCPLFVARKAVDHPLRMPGGVPLVARDPYGGLLARNRLFFAFSVRRPDGGSPAGVARVTWALDGRLARTDPTVPFTWAGLSGSRRRMPPGDHLVTVTVTPAGGGAAATARFRLTATDCQPASTFSTVEEVLEGPRARRGSSLYATSSFEAASGPTMRAVAFASPDVTVHIRAAVRGRVAGTLRLTSGNGSAPRTLVLRVPRSGSTLLARGRLRVRLRPGSTRFASVEELPPGTREVRVRLVAAGGRDLLRVRRIGPNRCRYRTAAEIAGGRATVRADGGTISGVCRIT